MTHIPAISGPHPRLPGTQDIYEFPNGFGASVVRGTFSYGGDEGLYELAVLHRGDITYETPITDDVLGYLSDDEVEATLDLIAALPAEGL